MEKSTVLVSIVTITYNNLENLKATCDSVLSQSFASYEWIVIDGGSNDGTKEFLIQHNDKIAFWCSEKDKGVYDAQNKGARQAKGDYVIFMNAGDTFHDPDVLKNVFSRKHHADVIYGDWTQVFEDGKIRTVRPDTDINYAWFYSENVCHQAMFIKTALIQSNPYDLRFKIYADWAKSMEFCQQGKYFKYVPYNICLFKMGGLSCLSPENNENELKQICAEFYPGSLRTIGVQNKRLRKKVKKLYRIIRILSVAIFLLILLALYFLLFG